MAITITKGYDWANGATVAPARLNLMQTGLVINCAEDRLLGRGTDAGAIQEIACTAAGRALLAAANAADQRTALGLGTMATQAANAVNILGGDAVLNVAQVNKVTEVMKTDYVTSGPIALALQDKSFASIGLTNNATFTCAGQAAGYRLTLALKNTTGGSITLTWPAWTATKSAALPTTLAAGEVIVVTLRATGTNLSDVFASYR